MSEMMYKSKPLVQSSGETTPFRFGTHYDQDYDYLNLETITYTIEIEKDGERFLGTCLELENIFVDGTDDEDVMRKIRIVIDEFLKSQNIQDKNFNLSQIVTF